MNFKPFMSLPRLFLCVFASITALVGSASALPAPTGNFYVNDFAGVMSLEDREAVLSRAVAVNNRYDGAQIVVVTVNSLEGLSIEEYAHRLFNAWGIGNRARNNGVLLLIVPGGKKGARMRIEVGYGLEGTLTDGAAGHILDRYVMPHYKKGDYSRAALRGFEKIAEVIAPGADPAASASSEGRFFGLDMDFLVESGGLVERVAGSFAILVFLFCFPIWIPAIIMVFILDNIDKKRLSRIVYDKNSLIRGQRIKKKFDVIRAVIRFAAVMAVLFAVSVPLNLLFPNSLFPAVGVMSLCAALAVAWALAFTKPRICPNCSKLSLFQCEENVITAATYEEKGMAQLIFACKACGNCYEDSKVLPVLRERSSDSDSGWSGSDSGGRGGGGSSGGGGASR